MISNFEKKFMILFLFLILMSAGFKNDLSDLGSNMSVNWDSFAVPASIYFLKENSYIFAFFSLLIFIVFFLKNKNKYIEKNQLALTYLFILSLFLFRLSFGFPDLSLKIFISIAICSLIYLFFSTLRLNYNINNEELFFKSIYFFSLAFLLVNYYTYLLGMGYVYGFNRFFGATAHPNFLGVQSAICLCLISYFIFSNKIFYKVTSQIIILGLLYLIFLSVSRTGLLFILIFFIILGYFKIKNKILLIMVIFFIFSVGYLFDDFFRIIFSNEVYDRGAGGGDTRSTVWFLMLNAIYEKPFFGYGLYMGASENSYLRLIANYGIFIATFYFIFIFIFIFKLIRQIRKIRQIRNINYFNMYVVLFSFLCTK